MTSKIDKTDRYEKAEMTSTVGISNVDQNNNENKDKVLGIVAMGGSNGHFIHQAMQGLKPHSDVWICNVMASIINPALYDMIWVMDNILEPEHRWSEFSMQAMINSGKPIMTSMPHPDWQGKEVLYPLEEVLKFIGNGYRPNTNTAYAFVYALMKGYKKIVLYGTDFAIPEHLKQKFPKQFFDLVDQVGMEYTIEGARCMTFWIAHASANGVQVYLPPDSILIPSRSYRPDRPFYGYPKDYKLKE